MRPTPLAMPAVRPPTQVPDSERVDRTTPVLPGGTSERCPVEPDTRRDRVFMIRLDGPEAGSMQTLGNEPMVLGRNPSGAVVVDDMGVSRSHARIFPVGAGHMIEDLGSRNGTFVGEARVERASLADGDVVRLGPHASFRFTVSDRRHQALLEQLYESSTRDALTGAYNRRHFFERLRTELAHASRHGTELSLIFLDVDHFKRVNDEHGHTVGDAALVHIFHIALATLRAEDLLARYGGEEVVVLLRGSGIGGAVAAAERIRSAIEQRPLSLDDRTVSLTVSAGCSALSECPDRTAAELIARADERVYAAKRTGRNRVVGVDCYRERFAP
jgi:diguanylate cyclase (GGDEF)-like protein